jgi:hypothetical protein
VSEVFKLPTKLGWDLDSARPPTTTAGLAQALDDIYDEVTNALRTQDDVWLDEMTDYHGTVKEKRWIIS